MLAYSFSFSCNRRIILVLSSLHVVHIQTVLFNSKTFIFICSNFIFSGMRGRTALSAQPCNGVLDDNDGDDNHENDNDDARRETIM